MLVVAIAVLSLSVTYFLSGSKPSSAPRAGGGFVTALCDSNNNSGATTTLQILNSTASVASTTIACFTSMAEQIDLNMFLVSTSSTSASLQWQVAFSNNNSDWYYEDGTNVSSNVLAQEGATPLLHTWTPGIIGTSTKNVTIKPVASRYTRIEFHSTGATVSLYEQLILKNIIQN